MVRPHRQRPVRLGLRENRAQFGLLVLVNAFVGGMVGLERTVLPLLAGQEFGLAASSAILSFLVAFGAVKALSNLLAGGLADRWGRKPVLLAGWLFGLPVPLLLIHAPTWDWVIAANVLLGVNQGLCWSTTVIMKIDLAGPRDRGLAMGLNEAAGYVAVSLAALGTGYLAGAYGLRPVPFYLGVVLALAGLLLSVLFVRETRGHSLYEAARPEHQEPRPPARRTAWVFRRTTWQDRSLFACCQAGLVNNLNDALVWGLLPVYLASRGLSVQSIGIIAAAYPFVWGARQIGTGSLSDRLGRKPLIVAGMIVQALGIGLFAIGDAFLHWLAGAVLLGYGTAMVYPTLLAAVSDLAHPSWRGTAVGVYRFWRDLGYVVGAIVTGVLADALGMTAAIAAVAVLTLGSGLVALATLRESLPQRRATTRAGVAERVTPEAPHEADP